jgi:hypothetical protein
MVRLSTIHGTSVRFDADTSRLRHGAPDKAPANVSLFVDPQGAMLVATNQAAPLCIVPAPDGGPCALLPLEGAPRLSLVEEPGGHLCLFSHHGAVVALADGAITLIDGPLAPEAFLTALTDQAQRCAEALRSDRWVDMPGHRILAPASAVPGHPEQLALDGRVFGMAGTEDPFVLDRPEGPMHRMRVVLPDGAMLHLARYRPLVCFAVFGSDAYYGCLGVALQSLATFGAFDGTICIAADRPRGQLRRHIPAAFQDRWLHRPLDPRSGLFARYDMASWGLGEFGPVLYMDTDVVANAPLTPLLIQLAGSRFLHIATENRLAPQLAGRLPAAYGGEVADWFGHWLLSHDPRLASRPFVMGSSGIIGFASVADASATFASVRALRRQVRPELIGSFTDQPLLNYALQTLDCGEYQLLDRFVDFARSADQAGTEQRGLMHFHAGVGNDRFKLATMRKYLARL